MQSQFFRLFSNENNWSNMTLTGIRLEDNITPTHTHVLNELLFKHTILRQTILIFIGFPKMCFDFPCSLWFHMNYSWGLSLLHQGQVKIHCLQHFYHSSLRTPGWMTSSLPLSHYRFLLHCIRLDLTSVLNMSQK